MPRRFVAAAAELARSASRLPPLSPPTTLATANNSPTATMSVTPEYNLHEAPTQYTALHLQLWLPKSQPPRLVTPATSLLSRSSSCCAAWPSYSLRLPPFVQPGDARAYSPSPPGSNLGTYHQPDSRATISTFCRADHIDKYILRSECYLSN